MVAIRSHCVDVSIEKNAISQGNSIELVKFIDKNSIDLILSDIPYGIGAEDWDVLHNNTNSAYLGSSPAQVHSGKIFKSRGKPINGWSEADRQIPYEYQKWCSSWAPDWLRVLKPGGSAFIFCGRRYSHRCTVALEDAGFLYKDTIAWIKPNAAHRAQRISCIFDRRNDQKNATKWKGWRVGNLRPIFEPILWFVKPYKIGGTITNNVSKYEVGAYNQDGFVNYNDKSDNVIKSGFSQNEKGQHPTQKPLSLMRPLIELTTITGQIVLDPFAGSGSTLVAAKQMQRDFIGIEENSEYVIIARKRIESIIL